MPDDAYEIRPIRFEERADWEPLWIAYQRLDGYALEFERARVIVWGFACSRTHRTLSGSEPEGGVENVCGLMGLARHFGARRPVAQVTRRGIRPSKRRKISWAGHDVGR